MILSVQDVSFSYSSKKVLDGISFSADRGSLISLLGPNGVGKSTLFQCMLGIQSRFSGKIELEGKDVCRLRARELARRIAYVPQSHYPAFNYSVMDMVLMGTTSHTGTFSSPGKEQVALAEDALLRVGLSDFAQRDYMRISGGERQLVLIARALSQQSRILILDEPTANLDYGNQLRVLTQMQALAKDGYTILQSTHHPEQSYLFSDRIIAMQSGRIIADGTPADVLTPALIYDLYGIETDIQSLKEDTVRVCVPRATKVLVHAPCGMPNICDSEISKLEAWRA